MGEGRGLRGRLGSAQCSEVVLALVCDTVWLTNSRSHRKLGCSKVIKCSSLPRLCTALLIWWHWRGIYAYIEKDRQSLLSSWAAAASPTNGCAEANTGRTRYAFVFTDGTADKLVMEKEAVYVSSLKGGWTAGGQPSTVLSCVTDCVSYWKSLVPMKDFSYYKMTSLSLRKFVSPSCLFEITLLKL